MNAAPVQVEILHGLVLFPGAQDDTQRRFFRRLSLMFVEPSQIELHLSRVGRLEIAYFQLNGNQASHVAMEEQKVDVIIVVIEGNSLLALDECKAGTELEQEALKVAKNRRF